jgi:hypothetical protein
MNSDPVFPDPVMASLKEIKFGEVSLSVQHAVRPLSLPHPLPPSSRWRLKPGYALFPRRGSHLTVFVRRH